MLCSLYLSASHKRTDLSRSVGGDVPDAPQRCSHYLTATRRILINVCRVWFGFPPSVCSHRLFLRTVEDACPYNKWGGFGSPPYCWFSPFVFRRAIRESPLQKQQDLIVACRGDHILAKQVCHEAKRNIESPATLFALSYGFNLCSHLSRAFPSGGRWQPKADG